MAVQEERMDRIWYGAFPAYYLAMVGYGITAALFPINAVRAVGGMDRAMNFGILIAIVATVLVVATFRSIFRQKPTIEFIATLVFLILMTVYLVFLYIAVANHEPGIRPGSAFLPLLFSIFPFTRVLTIIRSGRLRWLSWAVRR